MKPEEFYDPNDFPTSLQQERLWERIVRELPRKEEDKEARAPRRQAALLAALDRRSFIYGMAAALVLCFALYGVYAAAFSIASAGKPTEVRLDAAYQTAIREFEKVVPYVETKARLGRREQSDNERVALVAARKEQMTMLDGEIAALRSELRSGDVSPVKQAKLRNLYKMKLQVIQDMIEAGELDL